MLIEHVQIRGGGKSPRTLTTISGRQTASGKKYFVLIVDCGNDTQVKSRILEEHERLTKSGYSCILGLRDVRPAFTRNEIPKLERGLRTYVKTALCPVEFILQQMEIEAWFLAEYRHFHHIDPLITLEAIRKSLQFDPENEDMELRDHPSADLHACYQLAGQAYNKKRGRLGRTVRALDYAAVYMTPRCTRLEGLVRKLEEFLSS